MRLEMQLRTDLSGGWWLHTVLHTCSGICCYWVGGASQLVPKMNSFPRVRVRVMDRVRPRVKVRFDLGKSWLDVYWMPLCRSCVQSLTSCYRDASWVQDHWTALKTAVYSMPSLTLWPLKNAINRRADRATLWPCHSMIVVGWGEGIKQKSQCYTGVHQVKWPRWNTPALADWILKILPGLPILRSFKSLVDLV